MAGWWYTYPSENMTSSVGMMIIPNIWKVIKFHGSKPPTSIYIYIYGIEMNHCFLQDGND